MVQVTAIRPHDIERPVLDLSADALRVALQQMIAGSEEHGGIERYIDAVKLKSVMFQQALENIESGDLDIEAFKGLCTFMSTVRRRIGPWLPEDSFTVVRTALAELFDDSNPSMPGYHVFARIFRMTRVIAGSVISRRRCCTTVSRSGFP